MMNDSSVFKADIAQFIEMLRDPNATVNDRVDACHKLGLASGREAIEALIQSLDDDSVSVRWAAAEALLHHGYNVLEPLLQALSTRHSTYLYEGAHHILVRIPGPATRAVLQPVIDALESVGASAAVPVAASRALAELRT
ncbi:MAG: HEAT repeat domain-containing protein [Caldilineae bacterium]|nr:MAG: HEAT repeat domain-containing protein [Caldilineae bacterium]